MKLTMRPYRGDGDYWRVRNFLRDVFLANGRREFSWQPYRFDYCRWHAWENMGRYAIEDALFLWEVDGGRLAAALNPEGRNGVFLHVHPDFRSPELEVEMITLAEERFPVSLPGRPTRVIVFADSNDAMRKEALRARGYALDDGVEYQRRRPMDLPIADAPVAEGYEVRALGGPEELPARSRVSWRAFHPDAPEAEYEGWEWYRNIQRCPLYRRDLDIVAVAPGGKELAAFCTVWFDDVTRTGAFEPLGTAPEHQRKGLARAVMTEGLRRLKRLGATQAHIGSFEPRTHALNESLGFLEYDLCEPWKKEF